MTRTFPPAFSAAMRRYQATAAQYGEDSQQAQDAWLKAIILAPQWFMDEHAGPIAEQMGLLPSAPAGYDEAGQPVYTLSQIAHLQGITEEQAEKNLLQLMQAKRDAGQPLDGIRIGQPAHWRH